VREVMPLSVQTMRWGRERPFNAVVARAENHRARLDPDRLVVLAVEPV
jgi:hypothetical protein